MGAVGPASTEHAALGSKPYAWPGGKSLLGVKSGQGAGAVLTGSLWWWRVVPEPEMRFLGVRGRR